VVIIAFSAMLLASLGFFTTLGPGLAVAVAVMLLAALTLIPALLALTGPRVFWPSKSWQRPPRATTFGRLGRLVARILMIARLREEAADGNPPREAAALAVEHAGPSVVSAGVILPGTFGSLLLARVAFLTQMGWRSPSASSWPPSSSRCSWSRR
jgi:uncharacterized membrane protein YdfJ with MMPL/SSD domain